MINRKNDDSGVKMISGNGIATLLGKNSSYLHIASSVIFVAILFFYIFSIGSFFQVDISPLENRVNHHQSFSIYVFSKYVDETVIVCGITLWLALSLLKRLKIFIPVIYVGIIVFTALQGSTIFDVAVLLSFPIMLSFLIYNKFATRKILNFSGNLSLNYLSLLFIAISTISVIISSVPLFSFQSYKIPINDYAYDMFLLFGIFTPFLMFFLLSGSLIRLLIRNPLSKILKIGNNALVSDSNKKSRNVIPYLLLIVLLSVALSLIPHYPSINNDNQQVGADSGDYVLMLSTLTNSKDSSEFIHHAFVTVQYGDRPFFLFFMYTVAKMVPESPSFTLDHFSIILIPALVFSIFFLTREITSNDKISLFAAFVTAVSFQTLIGIYSGLYANLFALVIGYFSLVFLIRFLKKAGKLNFISYLLLMIVFVLSHVYTWTILTMVTSIFLILMYKLNCYDRKRIILLSLVVLLSISIDISRTVITSTGGGILQDTALASHGGAGPLQLILSWGNLTDIMQGYAGGQFASFIVLSLGLCWILRSNLREPTNILLAIFLSIGILPLLFGNELIQSRVLYDIPFQIPAGIALAYIGRKINWLVISPVFIWLFAVSLRMVTNFYFVSPS